ncbi:HAD family hydrolase [Demequina capsici]|uniref:HAD family hydrolase n=1 Tax=Demequina capsici TaxID=3075620 RepID=A0AA96F8Q8_9MICO|nr:HAD family hydrolase [Demequina sp. OYTSA14]WNM25507.1 HAD family hydrolase [Demequina sp. OYTSA14]
MSVEVLRGSSQAASVKVVSYDIFDTVLLRDGSSQTARLAQAAVRAAATLGVEPRSLLTLRRWSQANAYRAVDMERPDGEARIAAICRAATAPLGLGPEAAEVLLSTELDVDAEHLSPRPGILAMVADARAAGRRVIAVTDTWYSAEHVAELLTRVAGAQPFDHVYTSADLQATKRSGSAFVAVASVEGCPPGEMLHVGDSRDADHDNAVAAAWQAVHLPRSRRHALTRLVGKALAAPTYARGRRRWPS